ncbi:MAG: LysM peptidoglycan-binding domain-containing protein [Pyrinomonadaceae bacterium]|nr:LysM peptidoglycan-binding domain-containing protein [Sphingobacteriaceae bacterium]
MRLFLSVFCLLISSAGFSALSIDSIGVENTNGTLTILHKVGIKENYYSIARAYRVSPKSIIDLNGNAPLQIGVVIKVPTGRPFQTAPTSAQTTPSGLIIDYKVGPREYLYALAKRFNTSIEDIKELNNLRSNNLSIGQTLKIRPGSNAQPVPVPEPTAPATVITPIVTPAPEPEKLKIPSGRLGIAERSERGVAIWITDENLDGTKMLALHRTAPVGTVIKVTNPMSDKVTFVKVVGKFTENESTKDVIIVLTKATADLLGVLDKRFQVSIDYGIPNE